MRPKTPLAVGPTPNPGSVGAGLAILVVLVVGIAAVSRCSPSSTSPDNTAARLANENMSNAIAAQTPPPPEPLNAASVTRGTAHLRLAVNAEGLSGAMIYSQNCYDALTRQFTWAKLDTCGGFDMLAVRSIANADTSALANEASWFQSEAAAGRYLAAATGAGEPGPEADTRLSQLQARVARAATVGRRPPPVAEDNTAAGVGNTAVPLDDGDDE